MNKRTVCLTEEQYHKIIDILLNGYKGFRPNDRIATALALKTDGTILVIGANDMGQCNLPNM